MCGGVSFRHPWLCGAIMATVVWLRSSTGLADEPINTIRADVRPLLQAYDGTASVMMRHLPSGAEFVSEADRPMPLASLVKLPVMVAAYAADHAGRVSLADRLTLTAEDLVQGSTVVSMLSPGATFTLRDAVRMMMAHSDNTATNLVIGRIGLPATNELLDTLGLGSIRLNSFVGRRDTSLNAERSREYGLGNGTAAGFVALLGMLHDRSLEQKGLVAKGACEAMLEHLRACADKGPLPADLPAGTRVGHKTGWVAAVRTDAGLIDGPGGAIAYCVLTRDNPDGKGSGGAADQLIGKVLAIAVGAFAPREDEAGEVAPRSLGDGASGRIVEDLQRTLNTHLPPDERIGVDGAFGPATARAVMHFQRSVGLPESGRVDAATWRALGRIVDVESTPPPLPPLVAEVAPDGPPLVTAQAWAVVDATTGELLGGHAVDAVRHPASLTKLMTALLVMERHRDAPAALSEVVHVSRRAGTETGSTADLRPGDRVPLGELLYGLMLPSGNDAAMAIAEHLGSGLGGEGDPLGRFVALMNERAAALGLQETRYGNPHGLTVDGCGSSARNVAALAREAMTHPMLREIVATRRREATIDNIDGYTRTVLWKNTNRLLGIEGYSGIKTGTTSAAGACLAAIGERDGRRLIVVVLGSTSSDARYVDARNLLRHPWPAPTVP